jgi:hypothetical protein
VQIDQFRLPKDAEQVHQTMNQEFPGRGPQPSINSSQMFARQGQVPSGRLAGQHASMQQQNMQKQNYQQQQQQVQADKLSSVSKMTIPQAITLITLRLGAVEIKNVAIK